MNKTLKELGEEYLKEIDAINEKIDIYRKRLKKAMKEHNGDEISGDLSESMYFYTSVVIVQEPDSHPTFISITKLLFWLI